MLEVASFSEISASIVSVVICDEKTCLFVGLFEERVCVSPQDSGDSNVSVLNNGRQRMK